MKKDEELSYTETLKDIEITLGTVPSLLRTLPVGVLVQEWPLFKQHQLRELNVSLRPRRLIGSAIASNVKCSYCQRFHLGVAKTTMMGDAVGSEPSKAALFASLLSRRSFLQL
ncbi:MAG: carboxymuconolactone decarboxylase family protein [Thaumarchaeota archaeon]|nr:carboxymuconolactone decarboxylase family protein [Nitrososphaerota archaeon]MCL5318963.1 carboxymuconolactone decarboxylase family protein [Nitrososphaerota archaeon]